MAVDFNGVDQAIDLGLDLPYLNGAAGGTIMCWFILDTNVAVTLFDIAIGPPPGTSGVSRFSLSSNIGPSMDMTVRNADGDASSNINGAGTYTLGAWHHVAGTYDANTKAMRILIDGVLYQAGTATNATGTTIAATNAKDAAIGGEATASAPFWDGRIEDARIYDRMLSDAEVGTIYNARGTDGIVAGGQARFLLNEQAPGVAVVKVPNFWGGRDGTPVGATPPNYFDSIIRGSRTRQPIFARS